MTCSTQITSTMPSELLPRGLSEPLSGYKEAASYLCTDFPPSQYIGRSWLVINMVNALWSEVKSKGQHAVPGVRALALQPNRPGLQSLPLVSCVPEYTLQPLEVSFFTRSMGIFTIVLVPQGGCEDRKTSHTNAKSLWRWATVVAFFLQRSCPA